MLQVQIDRSGQTSRNEVADESRYAIPSGEAVAGDREDFAKVIGVSTNTVLRALHQLRDEGILEIQRGGRITVAGAPERGLVRDRAVELIRFARQHGWRTDELVQRIQRFA